MNSEKKPLYPVEAWTVTEESFDLANNYRNETAFALSNGYIGTRGTFEEGYDFSVDEGLEGNFINGFYESENIRYGEWNFGFPETSQSLLNLPNLKTTRIFIDGELFDMRTGKTEDYSRVLDMKRALVRRSLVWVSPGGKRLRIETERFVSFERKNIMAQRLKVTPLNFCGVLRLESMLDADVENHTRKTNPLVDYGPFGRHLTPTGSAIKRHGNMLLYRGKTTNSNLTMACGSLHILGKSAPDKADEIYGITNELSGIMSEKINELSAELIFNINCRVGERLTLDKFIAYSSCLDIPENELASFIKNELNRAAESGFETLSREQAKYMDRFWEMADVRIDGDDFLQQGIRFNLFHIMQAAGRDGRTGLGAKGLSGEGYEGHYFWDTEIYILPVFIYSFPELAKKLLDYRYNTLDEARKRARVLGHESGALYPWRTINGSEASTYVPLGTAQYHINADIAYAFRQYVQASGDFEYLKARAAEVLCETARVWADVGCFSEARDGKYCICCVTGPDEYSAFVDNNFYTNLMARENLKAAVEALRLLEEKDKPAYQALAEKIGLKAHEPALWAETAEKMYLPYDEKLGVYLQDDGLLLRKIWDDSRIPPEKRHLLYENYHPLFLWRQRMAKQADSLLAMYLHSGLFSTDEVRRNYDFYQNMTLHHSSLSTCIFGLLASRIGYRKEAYRYFAEAARMDLDDQHNNFYAGIHAANMAGTWQAIVMGFAGVSSGGGKLSISPYIPEQWKSYSFRLNFMGSQLEISVYEQISEVKLLNEVKAEFSLCGKDYILTEAGEKVAEKI